MHGIILTGKNLSVRRKIYPSTTSSFTNPWSTDPDANRALAGKRSLTDPPMLETHETLLKNGAKSRHRHLSVKRMERREKKTYTLRSM
jgi:hypothetical protein